MAINLTFSKLPWYSQLGAFFAISLLGAGVFWNWYAKPMQDTIDQREAQLATIRADIDRGLATARSLPAFRREVATLEAQLDRLRPVLPNEKDVGDLLRRIQGMATESNLTIRGFVPQAVAAKQLYVEWPIGLELDGTYHNLGSFLERVSKFPRIINVTSIHIKAKNGGTSRDTITANCTATTFVLVEPKSPTVSATAAIATPTAGSR